MFMVKKKIYFYFIPPTSQSPSKEGQTVFFLLQGYSDILDTHVFLPFIFTERNITHTTSCTWFCPEDSSAPAHIGLSHPLPSLSRLTDSMLWMVLHLSSEALLLGSLGAEAVIHSAGESIVAHSFSSISLQWIPRGWTDAGTAEPMTKNVSLCIRDAELSCINLNSCFQGGVPAPSQCDLIFQSILDGAIGWILTPKYIIPGSCTWYIMWNKHLRRCD